MESTFVQSGAAQARQSKTVDEECREGLVTGHLKDFVSRVLAHLMLDTAILRWTALLCCMECGSL